MNIKQHLSGVAIAYNPFRRTQEGEPNEKPAPPSRPQGSRYNKQKRAIADAIEYMRRYGKHKPLIFVLTSPGYTDAANEPKFLSKFLNTLRNNHGLGDYVWVRERTKKGYPHFHFVADMAFFDAKKLSGLWSSYFGSDALNSIRVGTRPIPGKKRLYHINSPRMAFYMSKYIGKGLEEDKAATKKRIRGFAISKNLSELSAPCVYSDRITETITGKHLREWEVEEVPDWIELEGYINPKQYDWKQPNPLHNVFIGYKKRSRKKPEKPQKNDI